jgi:hypothetical protein
MRVRSDLGREERSFSTDGLERRLYAATFPQTLQDILKTDGRLVAPFGDHGKIMQVFHEPVIPLPRQDDVTVAALLSDCPAFLDRSHSPSSLHNPRIL